MKFKIGQRVITNTYDDFNNFKGTIVGFRRKSSDNLRWNVLLDNSSEIVDPEQSFHDDELTLDKISTIKELFKND